MPRKAEGRVCGKSFTPCGKGADKIGAFNWMEVACSPECGQIYLDRVIESRKPKQGKKPQKKDNLSFDSFKSYEAEESPVEDKAFDMEI